MRVKRKSAWLLHFAAARLDPSAHSNLTTEQCELSQLLRRRLSLRLWGVPVLMPELGEQQASHAQPPRA